MHDESIVVNSNPRLNRSINVSLLATRQEFAIGSEVGAYKVLRKIGQGGMGVVYEAEHIMLHQRVALKTLILNEDEKEEITDRFLVEARVTAQLRHEGIVSVQTLELDKVSNVLYFAMEYIAMSPSRRQALLGSAIRDGKIWFEPYHSEASKKLLPLSLEDLYQYATKRRKRVHQRIVYQVLLDVSAALHAAHKFGAGVIHRDIKPANILIRPNGRAVITDFGVAKVVGSHLRKEILHHQQQSLSLRIDADGSSYHMILGTMEYLAPELREGAQPSPQSDLYALGAVAYQLLTGEMFTGAMSPPSAYGVSQGWDNLILKCLAPDPEARWKDLAVFRNAVIGLLKHQRRQLWWRHVRRVFFLGCLFVLGGVIQFIFNPLQFHAPQKAASSLEASDGHPSTTQNQVPKPQEYFTSSKSTISRLSPKIIETTPREVTTSSAQEPSVTATTPTDSAFSVRWVDHGLIYESIDGKSLTLQGVEPDFTLPATLRIPEFIHGLPVRFLGTRAFAGCKTLQRVELPATLLAIHEQAFHNSTLHEIQFPEGLRVIEKQAFKDTRLTDIQLPESLYGLGFGAFQNTPLQTTPKLPSQLHFIGPTVFTGCSFSDKGTLRYPKSITTLPPQALWYTSGVSGLFLPNIQTIPSRSLIYIASGCPGRYFPITFEQKQVTFHYDALHTWDARKIIELHFPKGATPIFDARFVRNKETAVQLVIAEEPIRHWDWDSKQWKDGEHPSAQNWIVDPNNNNLTWQYQHLADDTIVLTNLMGNADATLQIPQELEGKTVSALGNCLLQNHEAKELIVPEGIRHLGSLSFARMPKLQRVTLPSTIQWRSPKQNPVPGHSVDANHLFQHCPQLEEIEMYGVPETFPYAIFSHCPKLKHLILHDARVPQLNRYAFERTPVDGVRISTLDDNKCYLFKDNHIIQLPDLTPKQMSPSLVVKSDEEDSHSGTEDALFKDVIQTLPNSSCKVTYRYQKDGSYALFRTTRLPKKSSLIVASTINGLPVRHIASGALMSIRTDTTIVLSRVVEFAPNACPKVKPAMVLYPQGGPPIFSRHSFSRGLPKFKEIGTNKPRKLIAEDNDIAYLRTLTGCLVYAVKPTDATTFTIPERVGDYPIEGILPDAFEGCANLETLTVEGHTAKRLWQDSFAGCKALHILSIVSELPKSEVARYVLRASNAKGCSIRPPEIR